MSSQISLLDILMTVIQTNEAAFGGDVLTQNIPVVVRFSAPWCGPCRSYAPMFDKAATELQGKVRFVLVEADDNPGLTQQFNVRGLPTTLFFSQGEVKAAVTGVMTSLQLNERLAREFPEIVNT
ncbi:thioredoxin [Achromobacter phage Motura]|uniref:Thioredoxin n=1 Tax=Achromobacter phage Motura TaxID=2591403 RepID=A0A514CSM1_9CAUD|nr:thioredoxin domain [Achromobacter phage Motura]QDH83464.1 thioredoxin [Achromobacter phage Motura]